MKLEPGRVLLSVVMVTMGILHFTHKEVFAAVMPEYLPWHIPLVLISGVFEAALGIGLLFERTRVLAAYGLVALFIAVYPANINMALHPERHIAGAPFQPSAAMLWARLPLQFVFIWIALRYAKKGDAKRDAQSTKPRDFASPST
ncbi:MAG TPA: hypothetical protein VI299_20450 [Polyangiales bacterium]